MIIPDRSDNGLPEEGEPPWAVILAGGDGTRLQTLTTQIAGDRRPKQFCRLFGEKTLLTQTRERIAPVFLPHRHLYVVTRSHEAFYRDELSAPARVIAQPLNRGTGLAIAAATLQILRSGADPLIAFFPSDHYYASDEAFARTVRAALVSARQNPDSIVLIAAEPHYPETEYGWVETESGPEPHGSVAPLLRVRRFWEKPSLGEAVRLMRRHCLWNTFVIVGRAAAFAEMMYARIPEVLTRLADALARNTLDAVYRDLPSVDFSREVFVPQARRLLAIRDAASGWTDVGSPSRLIDTLIRNHIEPAWFLSGAAAL